MRVLSEEIARLESEMKSQRVALESICFTARDADLIESLEIIADKREQN
ncbi:MAG TPA: hypothetical protein VGK06_04085 [Methanosarcina sp.]|jgi:hypothetical protein